MRVDIKQHYADDYVLADISRVGDLVGVFDTFRPEVVIHMAAMVSRVTCEKSPHITVDTNLCGLNNIIQLCVQFESKLIYFSTSEVYGNISDPAELSETLVCEPNNRYGLTKYLGEKLVQYESNLRYVILRPFMFYDENETFGENRSAMIRFAENLVKREKITVHTGARRSWMHMSDAVICIEKSLRIPANEIINIGHPEVFSMKDVASKMCYLLGLNYADLVTETALPNKMTLDKTPCLVKQFELISHVPTVSFDDGIKIVIHTVKNRLNL